MSAFVHPLGSEVVALRGPESRSWSADLSAGYFVGEVDLRLVGARGALLLSDFVFVDSRGVRWDAEAGVLLDGSSIPWLIQRWMGSPWVGLHRFASVPHDVWCVRKTRPSDDVHRMYREACVAAGEQKAEWLYRGISLGARVGLAPRFPGVLAKTV